MVLRLCISLREIFSNLIAFTVINKYENGCIVKISTVFGLIYHIACQRAPLKRDFLNIYFTTFFGVGNIGNTSAMRVFFVCKCSKFNVDFKSGENNWDQLFSFSDNCIWIGCVRLSRLRREYLPWVVNVLTNWLKTLHITKRDFSQLNCLDSNQ